MTLATTDSAAVDLRGPALLPADDDVPATLARVRHDLVAMAGARFPAVPADEVATAVDAALGSFRDARFPDYLPVLAERRVVALLRRRSTHR